MLHPVLPPDPPPIIESLQPVNPASSASHTKFLSGVDTGIHEKTDKFKQPKRYWNTRKNRQIQATQGFGSVDNCG